MWYLDVNSVQTDFLILSSSFHIHSVLKLVPVLSQKSEKIHLVRTFCSSTSKRQLKTFFGLAPFRALFLEPIALFDRCENFIRKPRWFLHRFNSHWFKCSVSIDLPHRVQGLPICGFHACNFNSFVQVSKIRVSDLLAPFIPVNLHVCFHFFVRRINHRYRFQILMAMSSSLLVS